MDNDQDLSSQDQENLAHDVMDSLGVPEDESQPSQEDGQDDSDIVKDDDPHEVKKRLGMQAKRHKKETRALRDEISQLRELVMASQAPNSHEPEDSSYGQNFASEEDKIRHAVKLALQHKDQEAQRAKDRERAAHVHKQYQRLQDRLDNAISKYEDFDDVVKADDAPFTNAMRDAVLLIDNPEDVLYKLGKDKEQLKRISSLQPVDQAREIIKLSMALMGGGKGNYQGSAKPINAIRSNPVSSSYAVTEKTPVSELRKKMRSNWR